MIEVRSRIGDGRVLDLVGMFLKQDVLEDMQLWTPEQGTPQGAVISLLLANLYLHSVDVTMAEAGYQVVRYADDFVILCRTQEEAQGALDYVGKLVTGKGLTLHPEKTRLVDATVARIGFDFLGYHFEAGTRWPRKKMGRCNGNSLETIIQRVNSTLIGWFAYFKHSNKYTFEPIDGWIRRRLRSILRKREKRRGYSRGWDNMRWPNKVALKDG